MLSHDFQTVQIWIKFTLKKANSNITLYIGHICSLGKPNTSDVFFFHLLTSSFSLSSFFPPIFFLSFPPNYFSFLFPLSFYPQHYVFLLFHFSFHPFSFILPSVLLSSLFTYLHFTHCKTEGIRKKNVWKLRKKNERIKKKKLDGQK